MTDVLQDNSERILLASTIQQIKSIQQVQSESLDGLVRILCRDDANATPYWISFVNSAENQLTLSGHTLARWFDDRKLQEALTSALKRLVKNNIQVRLVMCSDDGLRSKAMRLGSDVRDSLNRKEQSKKYLYDIWNQLSPTEKTKLCIYEVANLPYLYCHNDIHCVTGTYFDNRNKKMNLQFIFQCGANSAERDYAEDFQTMIRGIQPLNLTTWGPTV